MNTLAGLALRLGKMLLQAAAIVVLVFLLARVVPGDTVDVLATQGDLTDAQQQVMRHELGLDRSIGAQLLAWSSAALAGDFGESIRFRRPVAGMLATALPTTLRFAGMSFVVGLVIAFGLAVMAATSGSRRTTALIDAVNIWSIAFPTFCVGVLGILVFSVWLGWLPVLGSMVLPVLIVGIDSAGQIVKPLYEELREATAAAHVRTARAKGLHPLRVVVVHLLPTALPIALTLSGLVLAGLVAGTLTMEVLFGLPGMGSLLLNAIHGRDYPVIQATIVVIAVALVVINALTDILHRLIDPRVTA
ncbi:MAG: ABC transporter permease [Rhodoplanes sp.]|uniref:ABC transporter permease n=1 Tax=Rhodoplanes sp. TaxID=1968906 RepID=UPI0017ED810E|nr:ABC transporter permease [Rhodoplanes sp.]NVO13091.1 ABC transporter permease [Rhodoplanes sp.]